MVDVRTLTDDELVQACDEYFTRVVRKVLPIGKQMNLSVSTYAYDTKKPEFTVEHRLSIGQYGSAIELKGDSMFALADQQLAHHHATANNQPRKVTLALEAPKPAIEDADYTEVAAPNVYDDKFDDVPF